MMSRTDESVDIVIIGGGPAGSSAARLLALWGRRVVLLTRGDSGRRDLAESLPPSTRKLLDVLGITSAVDEAGFLPARGNMVWWPGREPRVEEFEEEPGWQVERRRLDRLLRRLARDAGADVRLGATVEAVSSDGTAQRVRARVEADRGKGEGNVRTTRPTSGREDIELRVPLVLDCSGRAGVLASDGLRVRVGEARTTALVGVWRSEGGWGLPDDSFTLVEGYRDGWAWSIPVDPEARYFTAMVDPGATASTEKGGLEGMYRGEMGKTVHLAGLLDAADLVSSPWACGATPYSAKRFAGPGFLLVGDAASFIDPLSSYGVKKALASAWLAAIVANTVLEEPTMEEQALAFFEAREREACRSYFAGAAEFYAEGGTVHQHPFWSRRADAFPLAGGSRPGADAPKSHATSEIAAERWENRIGQPDIERLRRDPRVQSAFEALRRAPHVCLRPTGPTTLVQAPVVSGRLLVLEDQLQTPSHPEGVRHLRGVDVVSLIRLTQIVDDSTADVPGLYERYQKATGPVPLPDFLGALSVLLADGILENIASNNG